MPAPLCKEAARFRLEMLIAIPTACPPPQVTCVPHLNNTKPSLLPTGTNQKVPPPAVRMLALNEGKDHGFTFHLEP